jgi:acyl dehydratase
MVNAAPAVPFDPARLKARSFPVVRQRVDSHYTRLYALSLGVGSDPLDEHALRYVYEGARGGLKALPTMAVVLAYPGFWAREPETGIDWVKILHAEQRVALHRPLPTEGEVIGTTRVTRLIDKGADKGALMVSERELSAPDGTPYASLQQVAMLRGNGGFVERTGQPSDEPLPPLPATPERAPDAIDTQPTRADIALLYRLLADDNPLHADPAVARAAGFERPILHGLASFGLAGRAVLRQCADDEPHRLAGIAARFSSPVFPGETLVTDLWRDGRRRVHFRVRAAERGRVVLSHGLAEID